MDWKKLGKALLFPHIAVLILLLPIAAGLLTYSALFLKTDSVLSYVAYVTSAYTLTVWCCKMPYLIRFFKTFKEENQYARRWQDDDRLRVNLSLTGSLAWNTAYGLLQLWLGYDHHTFWFYSLAGYYISLAIMRFFLAAHTRKFKPGEKMKTELIKYRACGWIFLVMNLALSLMIFFMVYWNRTFVHHEITTIAMAAYTFTSFTMAVVNIVKYRKYNSPVYSASKVISLAAACVSLLTLESTMLTTFGQENSVQFRQVMLAATGIAIVLFIIVMAIYMIVQSNKKLQAIRREEHISCGKDGRKI